MKIIGIDTETTGLEIGDHRIIEVYAGVWDLATRAKIDEFNQRIDPQRSIQPAAQAVHKISAADLIGKPTWDVVGPTLHRFIGPHTLSVAHNGLEFDGPFLKYELNRIHLPFDMTIIDTMVGSRWATPNGKNPSLSDLCFACDVPYDAEKGHAADYDVDVMMACFFKGLDWGFFKLPEEMKEAA